MILSRDAEASWAIRKPPNGLIGAIVADLVTAPVGASPLYEAAYAWQRLMVW
jgi:hypothetical protein